MLYNELATLHMEILPAGSFNLADNAIRLKTRRRYEQFGMERVPLQPFGITSRSVRWQIRWVIVRSQEGCNPYNKTPAPSKVLLVLAICNECSVPFLTFLWSRQSF